MNYVTIKNGAAIALDFDLDTFFRLEKQVGFINTWDDKLLGKPRGTCDQEQVDTLALFMAEMGNTGMAKAGLQPVLTKDWVKKQMLPAYCRAYQIAVMMTISEANKTEETEEGGERDLILEELKKLKGAVTTHTGGSAPTHSKPASRSRRHKNKRRG